MNGSLYDRLGVQPDASLQQIHDAYTRALKNFRARIGTPDEPSPDLLGAIREAYMVLRDTEQRARYDQPQKRESGAASAPPGAQSPTTAGMAQHDALTRHPLEFTGDGASYFRIWIVNLLLSIITLGIYTAWAKVRREQYFHRNLRLDKAAFDYHGDPIAILKGRLIAVAAFVVLSVAQGFHPGLYGILLLAGIPLVPLLVVKAYRFRAHNTSYRGLRFSFDGGYREALKVFVGYGLLTLLTVGLALPLWIRAQRQFIVNHLAFGKSHFKNDFGIWSIYRIFLIPMAFGIGAVLFLSVGFAGIAASIQGEPNMAAMFGLLTGYFLIVLVGMLFIGPYLRVRIANLVWNATSLGPHQTQSTMRVLPYVGIVVTNFLLTILTLGFFQPWAQVRLARYRADHGALLAQGSLDTFIASEKAQKAAVGEEMADMFDFDVAL